MEPILELESARLILRQWSDNDLPAFAAMSADPQVMRYFPAPLSRLESAALIGRVRGHFAEHGFGLWALERKDTGAFIGFTGLGVVGFDAHFTPAVQIGWRLAREHWGLGYASEAAWTALRCAFDRLGLEEVVAFTAVDNLPSQKSCRPLACCTTRRMTSSIQSSRSAIHCVTMCSTESTASSGCRPCTVSRHGRLQCPPQWPGPIIDPPPQRRLRGFVLL